MHAHSSSLWALTVSLALGCLACGGDSPSRETPPASTSTAASAAGTPARSATATAPTGSAPAAEAASAAAATTSPDTSAAPPDLPATTPHSSAAPQDSPLAPPAGLDLARSPRVPLGEGLVIVYAAAEEQGDYEVVMRISTPGPDRFVVSYAATLPVDGTPTELRGSRTVLARDQQSARIYRVRWLSGRSEIARGTTALGPSREVLEDLRKDGRSECSLASIEAVGASFGAFGLPTPEYEGTLERVEAASVAIPVVVDGERAWLPAIHAKGTFDGLTGEVDAEFWFLNDPGNPLTLRATIGTSRFVVVRIDRPREKAGTALERALTDVGKVELPGVYFEFASAKLRKESDPALDEIAEVLRRHGDWRVRFEGHTDSVGGAASNLELSRARAEAVRRAVVQRLGTGDPRVEAAGFGHTRPRESNATPESRAMNRRVEVVRVR